MGKDIHIGFSIWIFCEEEQGYASNLVYPSNQMEAITIMLHFYHAL
jgi:hypothetical protein